MNLSCGVAADVGVGDVPGEAFLTVFGSVFAPVCGDFFFVVESVIVFWLI